MGVRCLQLNSRYLPQLQQVLAMPQSIGVVGGRPGSSLYFMGCQDSHVLYMDPHHVQPVSCPPPTTGLMLFPTAWQALSWCTVLGACLVSCHAL